MSSVVGLEPPYQCKVCGKGFAIPARLARHHRVHTGEKPFKCEYCDKTFSVKENLNVHRRIHTKERPYKCNICDRSFEHSGKLHRHMRTHTGERPHKCEVCGKTFVQSGQLVIHMRAHTGEKPYTCEHCQKGFTCSKQLKVHIRTHTGEKPYECDVCGKTFGYNHVLKMHKMSHLGERLYKCTLCDEIFTSRKALDRHIRDHSSSSSNNTRPREPEPHQQQQLSNMTWKSSPGNLTPPSLSPAAASQDPTLGWDGSDSEHLQPFRERGGVGGNEGSINWCRDGSGSRSPGYLSDDSGRGASPISDTLSPPRSPVSDRRPAVTTPPHILEPPSIDYNVMLQRLYPGLAAPRAGHTNGPPLAVVTTENGQRLAYPYPLLLHVPGPDQHQTLLEQREMERRQQQAEEQLRREENKRRREQIFMEAVKRVLEALVGRERLVRLGHPDASVDQVLGRTLTLMGSQPCQEPSLSAMDRIKVNLRLLLECSVPDQEMWNKFGWRGKPIDDIVSEFLNFC
ncbi:hypothetical protein Pcinc_001705 [Petrolisthes cinctipes]|uniref:C2H2-type domain-containing protein n=1 Tax=Petrolisthes cinctipes TaxID=88211 RepID=A0AAE1L2W9_PETCI|nr:hypothetical protein Pcinc_001705 [Petrolisthes cinctipes]